jgi:hypothetical protein
MDGRIRLIHWNAAEAAERAGRLAAAGYVVVHAPPRDGADLRAIRAGRFAAVVIALDRLPSHGRDVAMALRAARTTRTLPIVFVGGDPDKVVKVRAQLPDAVFTTWARVRGALRRAIARPPRAPQIPASSLAGYAATPLPVKLGIRPGTRVALDGAPEGWESALDPLPAGAATTRSGRADLTLWFVRARRDIAGGLVRRAPRAANAGLWIVWPKKASGVASDLSQTVVRAAALAAGLVDFKVCAVDATWSGLRFTRRSP